MPLTANFIADFSSFVNACASATASTDQLVAAAGKVGAEMDQAVAQAATSLRSVGAGIADFGKQAWSVLSSSQLQNFAGSVSTFASGFIHDFAEAETAVTRLGTAVKNAGAPPAVAASYEALASELQKVSRFTDEAIMDVMTKFTELGNVAPENMRKTVEATMNLAIALGISLPDAAKLMEKAAASNGEAMGRLKIKLGEAYEKGMNFDQIVDAIGKKFAGNFKADLETTAGSMENLKNQMNDINELVGKQLVEVLKTLSEYFHKLPEGVQTFALGFGIIATALAPVMVSLGSLVSMLGGGGAIVGALATAGEAIATFVAALVGWPAVIIAAIAALAYGIYKYWDEIVAATKKMYEAVKNFLTVSLPAAFTASLEAVAAWFAGIKHWMQDEFGKLVKWVTDQPPLITAAFQAMYMALIGGSIIPNTVNGIAAQFGRLDSVMFEPARVATTNAMRTFDELWASVQRFTMPLMFAGITMPNQSVKFANVFSSTSGLTQSTMPGQQITINMSGMFSADDPQTRAAVSSVVSDAVMQGMRGGRLLGTA